MKIFKHKVISTIIAGFIFIGNFTSAGYAALGNNDCLAPSTFIKQVINSTMRNEYLSLYSDKEPNKYYHKHHVARVNDFTRILAQKANLAQNEQDMLYRATLMHDFGSVDEDFELSATITDFANKNFTSQEEKDELAWYHRRGVFGEDDYQKQLAKKTKLLESKGIYKKLGITPTQLQKQLKGWNEFTPWNSIKEAKLRGIVFNDLEKALIIFHHTEAKYITLENVQKSFPHLNNQEIEKLHLDTHRLLPFLIAGDTLEASSNAERNRIRGLDTNKPFSLLYFYMNSRLAKGELNNKVYDLITSLLKNKDPDFLSIIKKARQLNILPKEDLEYIKEGKYNQSKIGIQLEKLNGKSFAEAKKALKTTTVSIEGKDYSPDYIEFNGELFILFETQKKTYIYKFINTSGKTEIVTSSRLAMLKNFFNTDKLMKHCADLIRKDLDNLLATNNMLKRIKTATLTPKDNEFEVYKNMLKDQNALVESTPSKPNLKKFIIKTGKDKIELIDIDIKTDQISNFNKRITQLAGDLDKAAKFSTITDKDASRNILYPEFSLFDLDKATDEINPFVEIDNMDEYTQIQKKTDLGIFSSVYKFWKYTTAHISDKRVVRELLDTDYYLLNLQALMDEAYSTTYLSSCSYKKIGSSVMLRDGNRFMVIFGANGLQTDVYDDKTFSEAEARHSISTALGKLKIVNEQMSEKERAPHVDKVMEIINQKEGLPDFSCKHLSESIGKAFGIKNYKYCRRDKIDKEQKIPRDRCPSLCAERSGIRRYGAAKYISRKTGQNIALVKLIKFPGNQFSAMYYSYETKKLDNMFFSQDDIDNVINNTPNDYDDMLVIGNLNPCYHCMTAFKDTLLQEYPAAKFTPKAVTVIASELNLHKKDLDKPKEEFIDAEDILSLNIGVEGDVKILNMPRYNIDQTNHLLRSLNAKKYGPNEMHVLFDQNYLLSNSVNSSLFTMLSQEIMEDEIDEVRNVIKVLKKYTSISDNEYFLNHLPLNSMAFVDDMLTLINEHYSIIAPSVKYTATAALKEIKKSNAILAEYIIDKMNNPETAYSNYVPTRQLDMIHKHKSFTDHAA